jgi:hypothetical protein
MRIIEKDQLSILAGDAREDNTNFVFVLMAGCLVE